MITELKRRAHSITPRRVVKSFSGVTTRAMKDYLKPNLELGPSEVILHGGTNDLRSRDPKEVAESIIDLARQIESSCDAKVTISELVCRRGPLSEAVNTANGHLTKFCRQNEWTLIRHQNITVSGLNKGGLHLNYKGNDQFSKNFKSYLN